MTKMIWRLQKCNINFNVYRFTLKVYLCNLFMSKFGSCVGIWFEIWNAVLVLVLVWTDIDNHALRASRQTGFDTSWVFERVGRIRTKEFLLSRFANFHAAYPFHNKIVSILKGESYYNNYTNRFCYVMLWMLLLLLQNFDQNEIITGLVLQLMMLQYLPRWVKLQTKAFLLLSKCAVISFKTIYLCFWLILKWFVATFCVCHLCEIDWLLLFIT